jgi:hypothetical protein
MNFVCLLAQTPILSPSVTPTATPFHVVMEQEPFWNSALGIFFVVVLATVVDIVTKAAMGTIR